MIKRTTLSELSKVIEAQQSTGSNGATLVGLTLMTALFGDAYMNAVGLSSFVGLFLSSFADKVSYRVAFFAALALQILMLLGAISALARSRWRSSLRESLVSALPFLRRRTAGTTLLGVRGTTHTALMVVAFVVTSVLAWILVASIGIFSLIGTFAGVFAVVALAAVATWVALAIALVSRMDRYTLIGLVAGLSVCAVGVGYSPPQGEIFAGARAVATVGDGAITDFRYWQAAIVVAILLVVTTAAIESEWERTTIVLEDKGDSGTRYFTYSPVGMVFPKPIYLSFQLPETRMIALSRKERDSQFTLVDTRDEHGRTPLHDRSLRIWNISALGSMVRTSFEQTDAGGYFRIKGVVGVLSVQAGFTAGERFDRDAVDLATDTLFTNSDLEGLLRRAVGTTFEALTADLRQTVDDVQSDVENIPYRMSFGSTMAPLPTTADALLHAANDARTKQQLARELLAEISTQSGKFNQVREKIIAIGPGFLQPWKEAIAADLTTAATAGQVSNALAETTRIIDLIGLRLSDVQTSFAGNADELKAKLATLRKEIDTRYKEAEARYQQAMDERTRLLGTVATTVIASPHHTTASVAQVISALSGAPSEPQQLSRPPDATLLKSDDDAASPT